MQLFDQQIKFLTSFIRFFESKTLKTLILDTFASEYAIKLMLFAFFDLEMLKTFSLRTFAIENTIKLMFFAFWEFGGWGMLEVNN